MEWKNKLFPDVQELIGLGFVVQYYNKPIFGNGYNIIRYEKTNHIYDLSYYHGKVSIVIHNHLDHMGRLDGDGDIAGYVYYSDCMSSVLKTKDEVLFAINHAKQVNDILGQFNKWICFP